MDPVLGSFKVGMLLLEGFNDGKELLVVNVIVELCINHGSAVESNEPGFSAAQFHL